jgi:hypothetical protein
VRSAHDPAPRRPLTRGERLGAAFVSLFILGLFAAELLREPSVRKLSVVFIALSWGPLLVIHELGHAVCARLVGFRVHEIVLGFGPELARFRALGARVTLRLIPVEGYVLPSPTRVEGARAASALVYFAGPAAELLAAGLVTLWIGGDTMFGTSDQVGVIAAQSFGVAALLGAGMNLIPHAAAGQASDGLGILLSFRTSDETFVYRMAHPTMAEAQRLIDADRPGAALDRLERELQRDPDNPFLPAMRARCLAAVGRAEEAFAELDALRARPHWSDLVEGERLHAAACVALETGDRELLGDAEGAARAALERMPGSADVEVTLAAIDIEQGRHAQADALLLQVFKSTRDPSLEDRCLAYLAVTAAALGRTDDAARFRGALLGRDGNARLRRQVQERERSLHGRGD